MSLGVIDARSEYGDGVCAVVGKGILELFGCDIAGVERAEGDAGVGRRTGRREWHW